MDDEQLGGFAVIVAIIVGVFLLVFGGAVGQTMQEARLERDCLLTDTVELNGTVFSCKRPEFFKGAPRE